MPVTVSVPPTVTVPVPGTQGPRGNTILPGSGAPGPTVGINGDMYLDLANYPTTATLYGPKTAGAWPGTGVVIGGGTATGVLLAINNLSDLADAAAARGHLGLGTAAVLDVGTGADTVAGGDDARFTRLLGTIPVSGTPAAGKVPQLTSPTAAAWATIGGGGGGGSIRTARARITNDNLAGLPSAPSWTTILTSAGTPLQGTINAAADDRLLYLPSFMYVGAHFLDWALLNTDGSVAQYATSDTASPSSEGNPSLYPSLTFSKDPGPGLFTVTDGTLNNGQATVALQHQGTNAGLVYAHDIYPWVLWLFNLGPEPA